MTGEPLDRRSAIGDPAPAEESPVDILQRWRRFGATWQVVSRTDECVVISLCRCDGGEEVQRLTSADPELIDWLGDRTDSEASRRSVGGGRTNDHQRPDARPDP